MGKVFPFLETYTSRMRGDTWYIEKFGSFDKCHLMCIIY